jgi:hypothetical protein
VLRASAEGNGSFEVVADAEDSAKLLVPSPATVSTMRERKFSRRMTWFVASAT